MRTTLTIDDGIVARLREIADRSGKSFKAVVNDALRARVADDQDAPGRSNRAELLAEADRIRAMSTGPFEDSVVLLREDRARR